jgi:hypothetical protein
MVTVALAELPASRLCDAALPETCPSRQHDQDRGPVEKLAPAVAGVLATLLAMSVSAQAIINDACAGERSRAARRTASSRYVTWLP